MISKKVVFLPYDFDTAIGINNEGALVFSYNLEDTDHLESGADVFNGQQSVLWNNLRDAFGGDIKSMYQTLRSTGALSYDKVERMFEEHQAKWGEAIFNEDAYFKYLAPLIDDGSGAYLSMLQGSKAEQRKWWLYNRFRYLDSKYNAGDALSDVIQLRGYAKANVTVTPYADVYASVKFGSYLQQVRAARNVPVTLTCPLDTVNDTEIYIYSSSQLASVGDLSGLKVGFADFSLATKIQSIKLGDSSASYDNGNLKELYLGNNVLLRSLDVRNCSGLGTGDMKSVDISGCKNIEQVYFDGTQITGINLPVGGILKKLHLPSTITNLTIRNQPSITEFVIPSYSSISTLWLDNVSSAVDEKAILRAIPANSRVRLANIRWEATDAAEIDGLYDILDTMRGLDEYGNNMDKAQISGTIHTSALTGAEIAAFNERYPYVTVTADHVASYLTYKTYDGSSTIKTVTCIDGVPQESAPSGPSRSSTAQYSYTFVGWNTTQDAQTAESGVTTNVIADRTVYAAYSRTVRTYTVTWKNADGTTLETDTNVPYGSTPQYNGSTPTYNGQTAKGWSPSVSTVTGNVTYTATYIPTYTVSFYNGSTLLDTVTVQQGGTAAYTGTTPTKTGVEDPENYQFSGWSPSNVNIQANTSCYAQYNFIGIEETITDSWAEIFVNISNGTYKTKYQIGDTKKLDLGTEGVVAMKIVAFDTDDQADGSGKAPITWISEQLLATSHRMNPDLVTNYSYPDSPSWTGNSSNVWTTQTAYCSNSTAEATWTVTATEAGTLSIGYKTSNGATSNNKLTVEVNGTAVATNFAGTSYVTHTVECAAGDTVTVHAIYSLLTASNYTGSVKFESTGGINITASVEDGPKRVRDSYQTGTGSIGGWEQSEMRTYLRETVKPLIPSIVRSAVVEVTKTQPSYNTAGNSITQTTTDDVWLPSYTEMFSSSGLYHTAFPNDTSRIKKKAGAASASWWWLRSAYNSNYFNIVYSSGSYTNNFAHTVGGIALGFCT